MATWLMERIEVVPKGQCSRVLAWCIRSLVQKEYGA
jgi:hypothetical protein